MRKKLNWSRLILRQLYDFFHAVPYGITYFKLMPLLPLVLPSATAQTGTMSSNNPYGIDANFNPSMTIIIVVLVLAFFFMGLLSVYIRQCTESRITGSARPAAAINSGNSTQGLDAALIQAFPVFVYSSVKDLKIGKGTLECAVCLSEFEDEETLRLLPKCDHVFHPNCIDAWLAFHTTCPVCRANLTLDSGELSGSMAESPNSSDSSDEPTSTSELTELTQVPIDVDEEQTRDSRVLLMVNTRESPQAKFPRSHSTGHLPVQAGESSERHTLRLPEEVRKQILSAKLRRTSSSVEALQRQWSSRRGYRSGGEGSSRGRSNVDRQVGRSERTARSDRWVFSKAPPFFSRTVSGKSVKSAADGDVTSMVAPSKSFFTSVIGPLDCLAVKMEGGEQQLSRPDF